MRHVLWRLGGSKIAPTGARSWIRAQGRLGYFVMRQHNEVPGVERTWHLADDSMPWSGAVVFSGPRWVVSLHWRLKRKEVAA